MYGFKSRWTAFLLKCHPRLRYIKFDKARGSNDASTSFEPLSSFLLTDDGAGEGTLNSGFKSAFCSKTKSTISLASLKTLCFLLVQEMGLEPTQPCDHWHLKPARLPFRHSCKYNTRYFHTPQIWRGGCINNTCPRFAPSFSDPTIKLYHIAADLSSLFCSFY